VRISSRCEYGVRAMVYLATRDDELPVPLSAIAASEGIPTAFLERILAGLRNGGLVLTARGVAGGYRLARPAHEISVADVVLALEGPLSLVGCLPSVSGCDRAEGCASREVWRRLDDAITGALAAITLEDLRTEAIAR
jgi:Rrf2 family transcriptional regulator, cysteine metabolism repressor